jgi:hypothetical protein
MTNAIGMTDFFVLEAGEYLERLDALAQTAPGTFDPAEEFVRVARAFRGSALMASQQSMARAAQGLESVGRAVRDGRVAWTEQARGAVVRAVDDCKVLLRRVRSPSAEDAARAEDIGAALERLAGRPAPASRAMGEGLDAGARAFVAREAAAIASALDRASRSLAAHPGSRDSLAGVTQAMSALRGVAVLNDLPPLGDVLVGVDGAVREVFATSGEVRESVAAAFGAGAKTLARAAREVVDLGRPAADGEEAAAFAALLLRAFAGSGDVIPVESLFYDDAGPHIIKEGVAPAGISRVEAVSQGEFLAGAANALQRVASPVLRDLRLFGMAASLRPLAGASGSPLTNALGRLAEAGRGAIERGAAAANLTMYVALIAQAAETLRAAATGDETTLGTQLDSVSTELNSLAKDVPAAAAPAAVAPAALAPAAVAPTPAAALEGLPLLFPPPETGPEREGSRTLVPLAAAYDTLAKLAAERAVPSASLDEVFGAPEEPVVPIESLAPSAPPAEEEGGVVTVEELAHAPVPVPAPDESDVVAIEALLYRGPAALKHALALRPELEALLADRNGGSPRLAELLREVFDLVQLGLGAER